MNLIYGILAHCKTDNMAFLETFLPPGDRHAAWLLYGMVLSLCFNGYDAGIMTVILANDQFIEYYDIDPGKNGLVATIPWATTGISFPRVRKPLQLTLSRACTTFPWWYSR